MATRMTHRITADDKEIIRGDKTSIGMIYNNMIGINGDSDWQTHDQYLDSMEYMLNVGIRGKQLTMERIKLQPPGPSQERDG